VRDQLRWLRGQGWQVMIIQVLDEAEVTTRAVADYLTGDLPAGAAAWPIELVEIETADRLRLTPTSDLIDRYVTSVTSWLTAIESACRDEAANHVRLETSWDFSEVVLGMLYQAGVVA
jgi:hypothetical protein